jgi:hypothetical protein
VAPCPKNGVAGPPHFWPRGGRPPHTGHMGVAEATPRPLGVARPPRKATKKKKKKREEWVGLWGWPDHPLGPGRGFGHPLRPVGGGPDHPQNPKPIARLLFFFFWPFRVARPPPKAWGWLRPPSYGRYGVAGHPLAKNGVVRPPHFLGKGWLQPPLISSPTFFFFFFFNF